MALTAPQSVIDRARKIKIILFDVDGVWTDGTIWLVPGSTGREVLDKIQGATGRDTSLGVQSSTMVEVKGYSAHDGLGIALGRMGGLKYGVITKRISETVATRAHDLKIEHVYQGQSFKMEPVRQICAQEGVTLDQVCYVGDDIIDLPVMREVGFAVAVANARERVKAEAHYVTPNAGGYGAARDTIEFVLEAQGKLEQCIQSYVDKSTSIAASMDIGRGGADLK
jgi:3-deoxy-D-manno-octulosonate 8-phosphate phosphatase (KDO 8-P phosphatase)